MKDKPKIELVDTPSTQMERDLQALVKADREERTSRAQVKIKAILMEERCTITPYITLSPKGMIPNIVIEAVDA